ncbi:MAG: C1 family peptidase [Polyangiaceae bacterium]|nr:C1 family peptidase [Polyangiaceae bacterium]
MTRGLGYLPDRGKLPAEAPDLTFRVGPTVEVPESVDLSPLVLSVLDQGHLGACVPSAGMQAIRMAQKRQGDAKPELGSVLFGYYAARSVDHTTGLDAGTQPRSFFRAINKVGFPPETLWPYSDRGGPEAPYRKMPSASAFRAAFDQHSPTVYRRISDVGGARILSLMRALADGFPIVFGLLVDSVFMDGEFDARVPFYGMNPRKMVGGHAMVLVGYKGAAFRVVNSWGSGWGDSGFCWLDAEVMMAARDIWAVERAPMRGAK